MARFILHLGYPKTGTTYLQRKIFTQLKNSFVVITPEFENCDVNIKRLKHDIQHGSVPEKVRQKFTGHDVLFSLEGLLFDSIRNMKDGRFAPMSWSGALEGLRFLTVDIASENIAIVLYLRRQDELLHSLYAESKIFHFNQSIELDTLEKYVDAVIAEDQTPEDPGYYYNFNNTLEEIKKVFPDSALHVRFYEDLDRNPEGEIAFWRELCDLPLHLVAGKENARRTEGGEKLTDHHNWLRYTLLRLKNKYFPALKLPNKLSRFIEISFNKLTLGKQENTKMTSEMRSQLRAKYGLVNTSEPTRSLIPKRLWQDYLATEVAEQTLQTPDQ